MPRWVFLLGVGRLLVAVAFVVTCEVLGPTPGVTEVNMKQIQKGMTLAEGEALLGSPDSLIPPVPYKVGTTIPRPPDGSWEDGPLRVVVLFDEDGRVEDVTCNQTWKEPPSPLDRLRKAFDP
jgi:hypothetical protein